MQLTMYFKDDQGLSWSWVRILLMARCTRCNIMW